jgi:hypothetical protein
MAAGALQRPLPPSTRTAPCLAMAVFTRTLPWPHFARVPPPPDPVPCRCRACCKKYAILTRQDFETVWARCVAAAAASAAAVEAAAAAEAAVAAAGAPVGATAGPTGAKGDHPGSAPGDGAVPLSLPPSPVRSVVHSASVCGHVHARGRVCMDDGAFVEFWLVCDVSRPQQSLPTLPSHTRTSLCCATGSPSHPSLPLPSFSLPSTLPPPPLPLLSLTRGLCDGAGRGGPG